MKLALLGNIDACKGMPTFRRAFAFGGDLARAIARLGHEVHVVVVGDCREIDSCRVVEQSENLTIHLVSGRRMRTQCLTLYSREVASMQAMLRDVKPDAVLAHWTYEYARAAVTSGFPAVVVAHDSPWRVWRLMREPRMLFRALYASLLVLPKVRNLVVVSPHIANELRCRCWKTVIPNGIASPAGAQDPAGEANGTVRRDARTIVCVTEGNRLKNAGAMLAAFEILKKAHPEWKLKVFSKGQDTVPREEILRVLREEADLFCSPSLEESFGMAFLEAMSCGVPCVGGAKSGAVPWVLGEAGALCDVTRPDVLAATIEYVMGDYERRVRMSLEGLRRAREEFNLDDVARRYIEVLEDARRLA